jgi:CBS domain containing-hemolysin-like protein
MMSSSLLYLIILLSCLVFEAFFVMQEMASVSFNKVRLQYFLSIGSKRAKWLNYLLSHPTKLYGTTLICSNAALLLGSEAARRLYESSGLSPDLAPLTQVVLVLVLAEMAPMFAARRHPEQVAMLGVPVLFVFSFILSPIIKFLDILCRLINKLFGVEAKKAIFLSREEIQKILEERDDSSNDDKDEFNSVVSGIFSIKTRTAKDIMTPINKSQLAPANLSVGALRQILSQNFVSYVPIYLRNNHNVIGVVYPRDLILVDDQAIVKDHMRPAWFITENQTLLSILKQFRLNNQVMAVVLSKTGQASGLLSLDALIDMIFAKTDDWDSLGPQGIGQIFLEKTFDADMTLESFNEAYGLHLKCLGAKTLSDIFVKTLGHIPNKGDVVRVENLELIVHESTLRGPKTILIKTKK